MSLDERPSAILPFSGTVGDLDYRPVRVVPRGCTLADASRYFAASDVEYLVIHDNRIPVGVVHKFDLTRQEKARAAPPESSVEPFMATQVITVQRDQAVIESLMFMIRHRVQFLLVMDDKEVAGIITQQDWLALQAAYPTQLLHRIASADSITALAALRPEANTTIRAHFETHGDAASLARVMTVVNDAITRSVLRMAIDEMAREGHGPPPARFAWLGMGSEGREAQTTTTDQDNGLVHDDLPEEEREAAAPWFALFAEKAVAGLERCGFARCAGDVMATNAQLRGSLDHFVRLFERIITKSGDEELFEAAIYFDFRCLFGHEGLVRSLRDRLFAAIEAHPFFMRHLVETTVQGSGPPLRTFRWWLYTVAGIAPPPFDLKKNGTAPLDAAVRVLGLLDGIRATRTLDRLQQSLEKGRMSKRLATDVEKAFDFLFRLRFELEFAAGEGGGHDGCPVDVKQLPPAQARYLGDALRTVLELQEFVYLQVTGRTIHWSVR